MPQGQFPQILAGMDYTAALIQSIAPLSAWKAADLPRSNTTTVANDGDLLIPVVANGSYIFLAGLFATGAAISTGDIKVTFTWPSGSGKWGSAGLATGSAVPNWNGARTSSGATPVGFGVNGASSSTAWIFGTLLNGATPGNLQLQWAQNTSNATATTLQAESFLAAIRTA
jgi:hypothetical protein